MEGAIRKAFELAAEIPGAYVPQQFANPSNPRAHYETTGPEIFEQAEGRIDAVAIGIGSAGTFAGVARYLKERLPTLHRVGVEPQGSIFGGGTPGPHRVEGIGQSFWPEILPKDSSPEGARGAPPRRPGRSPGASARESASSRSSPTAPSAT